VPPGGVAEHAALPKLPPDVLTAKAREHIFSGNLDKYSQAKGWHYEPSGSAEKGTYVMEPTRSAPDSHGVYVANVMINGVKKDARSSFFPANWTIQQVEDAILEAYANRQPTLRPGRFRGLLTTGLEIEMDLDPKGQIQTAYPIYQKGK
jgi:hypothetical protein